jgi:hypothetical protein
METVLYIFMRSDLHSLNPGKGMAQAAHAANLFMYNMEKQFDEAEMRAYPEDPVISETMEDYCHWVAQARGFGTTIVLDAGQYSDCLTHLREMLETSDGTFGGVLDTSYPVRDGQITHLVPLYTCAYYFKTERTTPATAEFINTFKLYQYQ